MVPILEMRGITKTFPGVKALDNVTLSVVPGEIHALVGENGAGKSTLMKVLSGVYPHGSYEGSILFEGEECRFAGIHDSEAKGIIIIHQELALVPLLSIAENIYLGNEITRRGVIDWQETWKRTEALLAKVGLRESPQARIDTLGVGKQQLVEIAKALSKKVKLLILDEPTAALQENDSATLLELLLEFKAQGITSILISHKLNEISRVADRLTVLRDGATVSGMERGEITENRIIRDMVGRDMAHRYPAREPRIGEVLMQVKDWSVWHPLHSDRQVIRDCSLTVRRGEVVGIAGLMGAGRTEFAMSLFGRSWGAKISGEVTIGGKPADLSSVPAAINAGLAYVTEDRKALGLVLDETILRNTSMANLPGVSSRGVIDANRERRVAEDYKSQLNTRTPTVFQRVVNLSGGNQQKVVLAKWLFTDPDVLILDEPTRGIDVGAKFEIYSIINTLADQGRGVILISSEMPELLGICDRIYVMNKGAFVGEFDRAEASQERIMESIMAGDRVAEGN
ncbi:ABC transporter ATP-binding protein [Cereibacter changlensis JA139]|uniref:ABC transporter ATP-binding protein n=2 Tax=Cereibacter changlensis TaxID=402884 RepID=A0A2T4JVI1_9RHOB|nr:multiple monosaccharide ABC transporter ATP-binding protein [Cereibacter changlensis]PTE21886.1 ABC transporter ATP-binding protein [Cereibacter changlensis JA139]PZX51626.1 putative multiple sugar transport system ATP-binding protein [Cereibacter changlensis]